MPGAKLRTSAPIRVRDAGTKDRRRAWGLLPASGRSDFLVSTQPASHAAKVHKGSAQCHAWNTPGTQEMSLPPLCSLHREPQARGGGILQLSSAALDPGFGRARCQPQSGVGSLKRCGFSLHWPRAIHTAGSPPWAGSPGSGAAPALPHPDTGLCLLLRLLPAPILARTAVWLRAWQGACYPPPQLGSASWPATCHMPYL